MGLIVFISTFLLLHSSTSLSSIEANEMEKKENAASHDRRHHEGDIALRQNVSEGTNHPNIEGKKKNKHENMKNSKNKRDGITADRTKSSDAAFLKTSEKLKRGLLIIPGLGTENRLHIVHNNIRVLVQSGILLPKSRREDIEKNAINGVNDVKGTKDYEKLWDCVIYIYTVKPKTDAIYNDGFWNKTVEIDYLDNFCDFVLNPGKLVSQNLHLVQPITVQYSYKYVFILLDDCRLMSKRNNNTISSSSSSNNNNNFINNDIISNHKQRRGERYRNKESFDLHKILRIMKLNNLTVASPMVRRYTNIFNFLFVQYIMTI